MGTFSHSITVIGPSGQRETLRALVDTGATFTTVPAQILERLGVRPHRTIRLQLADGRPVQRRLGWVRAELDGAEEQILCTFGEEGDLPSIGAHTLEALLLAVDPAGERLVPRDALWAGAHA